MDSNEIVHVMIIDAYGFKIISHTSTIYSTTS